MERRQIWCKPVGSSSESCFQLSIHLLQGSLMLQCLFELQKVKSASVGVLALDKETIVQMVSDHVFYHILLYRRSIKPVLLWYRRFWRANRLNTTSRITSSVPSRYVLFLLKEAEKFSGQMGKTDWESNRKQSLRLCLGLAADYSRQETKDHEDDVFCESTFE